MNKLAKETPELPAFYTKFQPLKYTHFGDNTKQKFNRMKYGKEPILKKYPPWFLVAN